MSRRLTSLLALLGLAALTAGTGAVVAGMRSPGTHAVVVPAVRPVPAPAHASASSPARQVPVADPAMLSIPAISVRAPVIRLGLNPDHTVQVPGFDHPGTVGWYRYGASPGTRGAAVIIGHLDTDRGIAVFARLHELRAGDQIHVIRSDSTVATFTVQTVRQYPAARFPDAQIYTDPGYPALRLITCGGTFDHVTRHYLAITVVYARSSGNS